MAGGARATREEENPPTSKAGQGRPRTRQQPRGVQGVPSQYRAETEQGNISHPVAAQHAASSNLNLDQRSSVVSQGGSCRHGARRRFEFRGKGLEQRRTFLRTSSPCLAWARPLANERHPTSQSPCVPNAARLPLSRKRRRHIAIKEDHSSSASCVQFGSRHAGDVHAKQSKNRPPALRLNRLPRCRPSFWTTIGISTRRQSRLEGQASQDTPWSRSLVSNDNNIII